MSKVIQLVTHGIWLVALTDDGKIYRQFADESGWCVIDHPCATKQNPESHVAEPEDDDGWIEWHGGECPVNGEAIVDLKLDDGSRDCDKARSWSWEVYASEHRRNITHYRIHKIDDKSPLRCHTVPAEYTPTEWPEGALWWAVDEDQMAWFYPDSEPYIDGHVWLRDPKHIYSDLISDISYIKCTIKDWRTSKRKRPDNI